MKKVLLILSILFAAGTLFAQDMDQEGRLIKYRQKTVIDFEDIMLEGQIKKPTGSFLSDRKGKQFQTLINLKKEFNKELVKSVDLLN
ncbi:hypothetical protein KAH37_02425 [bacterium]|nr:hypothetical protein [bacterium]